jgi:hypothetical protein
MEVSMSLSITKEVYLAGISADDVENMYKALGRMPSPSKHDLLDVKRLLLAAREAELAKSRSVTKWNDLFKLFVK